MVCSTDLSFALGELEVSGGDIVLEVDEVLVAFIVLAGGGREPQRFKRPPPPGRRGKLEIRWLRLAWPGSSPALGLPVMAAERECSIDGTHRADGVGMAVRPERLQRSSKRILPPL